MDTYQEYQLLDSGDQKRLEKIGPYTVIRPCSQAVWSPKDPSKWERVDAMFSREKEQDRWTFNKQLPNCWMAKIQDVLFQIELTDFGHIGLFPEHSELWPWMKKHPLEKGMKVLNLFAYTGGATMFLAKHGAHVCHVDASKTTVQWARENANLNQLQDRPIRWIIDDVIKFLKREVKRSSFYQGILLDPPSFGRGTEGQIFKIEDDIHELLSLCREVLADNPQFVIFTGHTPGFTPLVMDHLMKQYFGDLKGHFSSGEMVVPSVSNLALPSGSFARWSDVS